MRHVDHGVLAIGEDGPVEVRLAAAQAGAQVRSFAPSIIKKAVTGTGRAEKEQVGRMVSVLLGIAVRERMDATDALAAAIYGLLRARAPAAESAALGRSLRGRR